MFKFIALFFVLLIFTNCSHHLYIVRHAEKSSEPKNNPNLTAYGYKRAAGLNTLLSKKNIKKIYSTNTNRTIQTAQPLALANNLSIEKYTNDTLTNLFKTIFLSNQNTLVVGHSNTVLAMLDTMQLKHSIKKIEDNEYDNFFIIKIKKYCNTCLMPFKATMKQHSYGIPYLPNK